MNVSRFHAFLAFAAIIALRLAVGFHFFNEGRAKLESGTFTAEYFLDGAKGPLAPSFRRLLDDPDGEELLCVRRDQNSEGDVRYDFEPESTWSHWDQFAKDVTEAYGLGSETLQQELVSQREQLAEKIRTARSEKDESVNTRKLEQERADAAEDILKVRGQLKDAKDILQYHKQLLAGWLDGNQTDLVSHFSTASRLSGFERDGANRADAMIEVESLREQVDEIANDRNKKLQGWKTDVTEIWDSLENQMNALAIPQQAGERSVALSRPYAPQNSLLKRVDRIIPWFDTIVGVLLIVGLFTRLASLAGAAFLFSVVMTQPFWIPTADPTYYQWVELAALLVLFATCAGRMGGLDTFLTRKKYRSNVEPGASS